MSLPKTAWATASVAVCPAISDILKGPHNRDMEPAARVVPHPMQQDLRASKRPAVAVLPHHVRASVASGHCSGRKRDSTAAGVTQTGEGPPAQCRGLQIPKYPLPDSRPGRLLTEPARRAHARAPAQVRQSTAFEKLAPRVRRESPSKAITSH